MKKATISESDLLELWEKLNGLTNYVTLKMRMPCILPEHKNDLREIRKALEVITGPRYPIYYSGPVAIIPE